jgi:uncharacterized protein YjbI with pentapeptide repeats
MLHSIVQKGASLMSAEDKSQVSSFSSEDEKGDQKALNRSQDNKSHKTAPNWTGFQGKTLWNWLQLLLIPLVLIVGGLSFSIYLHDTEQQQALDQQQAVILQTYIDNIQDLLLNYNLLKSTQDDEIAKLARARTLIAMKGLDPVRKGRLLTFIYETQLIGFFEDNNDNTAASIISLRDVDLSNADLSNTYLGAADLSSTNLSGADLIGAFLGVTFLGDAILANANFSGADLHLAYLSGADLSNANLSGADFRFADLLHANLSSANLTGAHNLTQRQLDQVYSCKDATLPSGLICHFTP